MSTLANKEAVLGLGLDSLGDLAGLLVEPVESNGGPRELALDLIDEDENQPRQADNPGFSQESLGELAVTIRDRGVKSPISVRENTLVPGRFIINHGARRYRASRIAGKTTIPGFIDNDYNEADQVIENLQRNELTAREIADFIGRELAKGMSKSAVARLIGKSGAFVKQHHTLLELPDPIADIFNSGRVKDVTVINELVTAFKRDPMDVSEWLSDVNNEVTRGSVKLLRDYLEYKRQSGADQDESVDTENQADDMPNGAGDCQIEEEVPQEKTTDPSKIRNAIVQVEYQGRMARLLTKRRPPGLGWGWVKFEDDGEVIDLELRALTLVGIIEG